ncbi:MAG: hypothetical protein JNK49_12250 [Planctomycetes bacterium]|nr:hypothetical protein [Planctomycetota bacterium]
MSRHNRFAGSLGALAVLAAAHAQQPIVQTVYSSGTTQSRYDMVILADGYQAAEQTTFQNNVQAFLTALFQKQPYATFASYYNVHTVFRASVDSGASHPDANPPIVRNTAYGAAYNTGGTARCLYINNTSQALADAALAPANEGRVLVFVNDSRYGGCAGQFAVSYNGSSMTEVQIHEIGHSLGSLADEYDYPNQTYTGGEPGQANISASPTGQKWSHWWGTDGISAFQGAGYYLYGLYRPKNNCLMRSLGVPMCAVCQEQSTRTLNSITNVITSTLPTASSLSLNVGTVQPFAFTHFVPAGNSPLIQWQLDGNVIPGATSPSWLLDTTNLTLGTHTVEASVLDRTPIVRQDPSQTMRERRTWTVVVTDPNAANLRFSALSSNLVWVQPGQSPVLSYTLANDGPAAAGPFDVEFFLSTTTSYDPNRSMYLGKQAFASFAVGSQAQQYSPQVPWRLEGRVYYVFAVADRQNSVRETNENDNSRYGAFVGQAGPCVTKLEYADPLVYPLSAAALPVSTGGAVQPTVVARCAAPGTLYLIAWGCSGTVPGTPLAPGITVPLNQDLCTQLGLAAVNGAWFQNFLGTLDAQGLGRATFQVPANSGLLASTGHFAALLVDPVQGFSGVTNPVVIDLQ